MFLCLRAILLHSELYLSEGEVEVSLQGAPLSGDDLVEDGGQQQGQAHPQSDEEETCQTLLGVVAVMFALRVRILLPQQQHSLKKKTKTVRLSVTATTN